MEIPKTLDHVLEAAIQGRATLVTFEYDDGGLEVAYFVGNTGVGVLVTNRSHVRALVSELVDRANLERRDRGKFEARVGGASHVVSVTVRDHFGESAFDLRFSPAGHPEVRAARKAPGRRRA